MMNSNISLSQSLRSPLFHHPPVAVENEKNHSYQSHIGKKEISCRHYFVFRLKVKLSCTFGGLEAFSSFNAVRLQLAASISAFVSPTTLEFFGLFSVTTQIPSNAFAAPALAASISAFAEPATSRDAFADMGDGAPPNPKLKSIWDLRWRRIRIWDLCSLAPLNSS
uniref:Uncharacterized protein n=1 Tax=Nelumbo nucifera TaxID=4432 RepID=A0A822XVQ7_NELNU|nr:TPA_asm: hypothetical protein HUJ06_025296 [Nelumbo nucifera]